MRSAVRAWWAAAAAGLLALPAPAQQPPPAPPKEPAAAPRWDKYVSQQGTDKALHDFFEANKEVFDGSMVRARHILLTPATNDQAAGDKAKADLLLLKQQIEQQVTAGLAKQPPTGD